jgi:hypothetical protein
VTLTPYEARQSMEPARQADLRVQDAYEIGQRNERMEHSPDDDPRIREAHRMGLDEYAKARRRRLAGETRRKTGGYLARAGRSVTDRTGEVPTGGSSGSWVGVLVGILALIALFLFLNRAGLAANVITGAVHGLTWLVAPEILPL